MAPVGTYNSVLVIVSILIAITASYTALDLGQRVRASAGWTRRSWLGAAAFAMGGGIWAMHFVAMLAFSMPQVALAYDPWLTALSLAVAVGATGSGFLIMGGMQRAPLRLLPAGMLMGMGIVVMHYSGMAAMRMPETVRYDRWWVAMSVLIAIGSATAALWMTARPVRLVERLAAAVVMGIAVAGTHYTGMHAARFTPLIVFGHVGGDAALHRASLAIAVSVAAFIVLFSAIVVAMFDRQFAQAAAREANALRRSEERFRALYRGTPLPLHSLDGDGRIEQVSNIWLDMMGYARSEVIGRPLFDFLAKDSARSLRDEDWLTLIAQGHISSRNYQAVTKAGAFLDVVASARVEHDGDGRLLHVLGGLSDVTQRKRAEEGLRQVQKIEAIGHLTGGIAHDFNNLLAVVIGNLDLLQKRLPKGDPRLDTLLENALAGANRGASVTQRLLSFARQQDLRPEPIDVVELVHGMRDLLQRSLGPMIRVETWFPLGLARARADAHQLELALLNLAVNARDAMPDGGSIEIVALHETVPSGGADGLLPGRYVRLSMIDQGSGMDAATLDRATEPFYTTKGTGKGKGKGKGTGLGLSMVQGLAAQSGGRLVLHSAVGKGTTAELWLPVALAADAPREVPSEPAPITRAVADACRVLAVDDDPLVLANTVATLEDLGHRVVAAASGPEALMLMEDGERIDLLVTDQLMPQMTGTQLIERIRAGLPSLPAMIVSGFSELAQPAPDVMLLRKPFTQGALANAVRRTLSSGNVVPLRSASR